jgi:molecular chaperone DnaK
MDDKTVWGIDLGTTYSCVARMDEHGYATVTTNAEGEPITPSVVLFESEDNVVVGQPAKDQMQLTPELVCELVKQQMGNPEWRFEAHGTEYSAAEVSALILSELAAAAGAATGSTVENVVITVPAYFGITERNATEAAGKMAGLTVKSVLSEPTAAAFSYGFAQTAGTEETVLVYDLGGGTFDVTIIALEPSESGTGTSIRVVATTGDHRLGGSLWDQRLVDLLARKFMAEKPDANDPLDDPIASADLRVKAEDIKRKLSTAESHKELMLVGADRANVTVTRAEFEESTADLLSQTIEFTVQALEDAKGRGVEAIDRVLLVGGSSFMPAVSRALVERFPDWTPELRDPNQAVAKGAALAGLGRLVHDEVTGEPAEGDGTGSTGPLDSAALDEVANEMHLSREVAEKLATTTFRNVCSRGFGVKILKEDAPERWPRPNEDFKIDYIIRPQTPLPVSIDTEGQTEVYGTSADGQESVMIEIWEQSSQHLSEELASNTMIEAAELRFARQYPRGAAITVSMGMDNDGLILTRAVDPDGREIPIKASGAGAVITEEQIAEGAAKLQELRRRAG